MIEDMDDEDILLALDAAVTVKAPDYEPETHDERRRVFALAVVVDRTEPLRLGPDDFMTMCSRVNEWLKTGQDKPPKPATKLEMVKKA